MNAEVVAKRMGAMGAELDLLLAEPLDADRARADRDLLRLMLVSQVRARDV